MEFSEVIIALVAILGIFFLPIMTGGYILYFLLKTRNAERLEMIKQGMMPSSQPKASPNKFNSLRNGCLFVGLAVGAGLGGMVDYIFNLTNIQSFLAILSCTVLFLGIGYITFFLLVKNKNTDEE